MKPIVPISAGFTPDIKGAGMMAGSLALLASKGVRIPMSACVTPRAYHLYIQDTGLEERMSMELGRKPLSGLKLEEIWDLSLRLRSMILNTPVPKVLRHEMISVLEGMYGDSFVTVYSSPAGDSLTARDIFGAPDKGKDVSGPYVILDAVKMAWASLWTDNALLSCRDHDRDPLSEATSVLVQERIHGERHGTVFSRCPGKDTLVLVESHGDRWFLERASGRIWSFEPALKGHDSVPVEPAAHVRDRAGMPDTKPILHEALLGEIHGLAVMAGESSGSPLAVDWVVRSGELFALRVRPDRCGKGHLRGRTFSCGPAGDIAPDKSGTKKYEAGARFLKDISDAAGACRDRDLSCLPDPVLADEIGERLSAYNTWKEKLFRAGIDLAHGMAMFGRIYNDAVRPVDPCEFMELLICGTKLRLRRTRLLKMMARLVRYDENLLMEPGKRFHEYGSTLTAGAGQGFTDLSVHRLHGMHGLNSPCVDERELMEKHPGRRDNRGASIDRLMEDFFSYIPQEERESVAEILYRARTDCMIREQAGIHLGRLKKFLDDALHEGRKRTAGRRDIHSSPEDVILGLRDRGHRPRIGDEAGNRGEDNPRFTARQIMGNPAGHGIAVGRARIMYGDEGILNFRKGEILVSDTIGPANAFVIPLADAVVIEKGGMLVHGALLAREYMIPCITGVSDATTLIRTGDLITVDGHLGIVTIEPGKRLKSEAAEGER